jgi:hypothetical protein
MGKPIHLLLGAAVALAALAGGLYWGRALFIDGAHANGDGGRDAPFSAHMSQVVLPSDPDVAAIHHSLEAREQVAREVIAGRVTLLEAAARFQAITLSRPAHLPMSLAGFPGNSEEERICRQVIHFVEIQMEGHPDASAEVARLNRELQDQLAQTGVIILPRITVLNATRAVD